MMHVFVDFFLFRWCLTLKFIFNETIFVVKPVFSFFNSKISLACFADGHGKVKFEIFATKSTARPDEK